VMPYAYIGISGVVYTLSVACGLGFRTQAMTGRVESALRWLLGSGELDAPGLYFGTAGVAVAVAAAVGAKIVDCSEGTSEFIRNCLNISTSETGVMRGSAGIGIASLLCADILHDSTFCRNAHGCADYLMSCQHGDGSWQPCGGKTAEEEPYTGFAEGVAGI